MAAQLSSVVMSAFCRWVPSSLYWRAPQACVDRGWVGGWVGGWVDRQHPWMDTELLRNSSGSMNSSDIGVQEQLWAGAHLAAQCVERS